MDTNSLIEIAGAIVTVASAITAIIHTPATDAPAWQRYLYLVVEKLALVGARTKENPAAAQAALQAFRAATKGDLASAAAEAAVAYQGLSAQPINAVVSTATPTSIVAALGIAAAVGVGGCTSTGQMSPAVQQIVMASCQIDAAFAPAAVKIGSVVTTAIAPELAPAVAAADAVDQVAHQAVQSACAAVGGVAVAVTTTTTVTAPPVVVVPAAAPVVQVAQ